MPKTPDQDGRVDIDLSDVDLTDELPVLIETAVFESDKHLVVVAEDEDTENTARVMALVSQEVESVEALKTDLEQRAAKIEALERDIERLNTRWLDIERRVHEKDAAISSLTGALEAARSTIREHRSVEDNLAAEIAERDSRIARLLEKTDLLQKEAAEARTELQKLREEREAERREVATLRAETARRAPADVEHVVAQRAAQVQAEAVSSELEAARKEIADARAQLEQARTDAARMEQVLVDKDRAVAARDERIRTLQLEIQQRPGAIVQLNVPDASRQAPDQKTVLRADAAKDPGAGTPALICLTSDGPRRFALVKGTITIGRSASCDIQILTHFVSREHARLTVSTRGGVVIEDLGSTNGVFVNSVRVDRHELHHGDVVTVGESQFRFLETMAH
jgi:FHA domain-containing protein